jgi:predicted O-methyltransferase YrrM
MSFGKVVNINKKDYIVSLNEFCKKPHGEYNNLNILEKLGEHENIIGLINDLTELASENNSIKILDCYNCSHGGFIPLNSTEHFDNINIFTFDEQQIKYMKNNIEYHEYKNIKVNPLYQSYKSNTDCKSEELHIVFLEMNNDSVENSIKKLLENSVENGNDECIYIFPDTLDINLNSSAYTRYKMLKNNYVLLLPVNRFSKFNELFHYYVKDKKINSTQQGIELSPCEYIELDYDNLIHFTMIVKNAGKMFEEVLTKNLPIIDRWTILDTGSTDETIDIINKVLVGKKKGKLYQEPFIDFGITRNRCLELAGNSCKYRLMLDDTYVIQDELRDFLETIRGDQFADSYSLYVTSDDVQYCSNRITKTTSNLKYIYKIHEVIQMENNVNVCVPIEKTRIHDMRAEYMEERTMNRKELDLRLLFEMVNELPNDPRHLYYLGQTYNLLKKHELAFEYFMKRVEHPVEGNIQEKLDACFEAARLANFFLNKSWEECEKLYMRSYEMDKTRPESMYFIGIHHKLNGDNLMAYEYIKKAFELGYPVHCQYSLKPTLSYHFVPKFLAELCYMFNDYETGEKACKLFLEHRIMGDDYLDVMKNWNDIYTILNKYSIKSISPNPKINEKPYLCFLADGGFNQWSGSSIEEIGVGGSETYIIELSKYIQKCGKYNVIVFCNCEKNEIYQGVEYRYILEFFDFVKNNVVEHCIISRYSEYLPFAFKSHIKNVYFTAHDLTPSGLVIPIDPKLKQVFCLSEWHVSHFTEIFPSIKHLTVPFYYGIDIDNFDSSNRETINRREKQLYKFIYSSFPHRGLLTLLQMWPRIINIYPSASLYIHCDVENKWVNENAKEHMKIVKIILNEMLKDKKNNIYYMGWTSKSILSESWKSADIWFYPCSFNETFCLTALEAAISNTVVVTSDWAALQNTVADRGIMISGNPSEKEWQNKALEQIFTVLDDRNKRQYFVEKNYNWAKNMSWENRANDLVNILEKYSLVERTGSAEKTMSVEIKNNEDKISNIQIQNPFIKKTELKETHNEIHKYIDLDLEYKGMYNWTNDLPSNTRQDYLDIIEYFGKKKNNEILKTKTTIDILKNLGQRKVNILEIGTYTGVSIINLLNLIPNSYATVIDTWKNYDECQLMENIDKNQIEQSFYRNIKTKKLEDKIKVLKGDSFEMLMKLVKQNEKFDFVYVDGSHKCLDCYSDLLLSWELLNVGGIMVIDDVPYNKENGVLESPYEGVIHFMKKYENKYKILKNNYRLFLEKI